MSRVYRYIFLYIISRFGNHLAYFITSLVSRKLLFCFSDFLGFSLSLLKLLGLQNKLLDACNRLSEALIGKTGSQNKLKLFPDAEAGITCVNSDWRSELFLRAGLQQKNKIKQTDTIIKVQLTPKIISVNNSIISNLQFDWLIQIIFNVIGSCRLSSIWLVMEDTLYLYFYNITLFDKNSFQMIKRLQSWTKYLERKLFLTIFIFLPMKPPLPDTMLEKHQKNFCREYLQIKQHCIEGEELSKINSVL